jgi:hypothetical protein
MDGTKETVDLSKAVTANSARWGVAANSATGKKF